ncbi:MAG: CRTAC1 family protein, partial [Vicinamibacteria bacterium]
IGVPVYCGPTGLEGAKDVYLRNEGDGRFVEASQDSGLADASAAYGLGVVAGDYDGDGDSDLYVANDSMPNFLYRNDGSGRFTEAALFSGVAYNTDGLAQAGMGVDLGDLDGDGNLDLFVTNFSHDTNTAYRNLGTGVFSDATAEMSLRMPSWFYLGWATRFLDLDNDGDEDLFVANGHVYPEAERADPNTRYAQRNQVYWNLGGGRFEERELAPGDAMSEAFSSRGGAFGDIDDDGDPDAAIVNIDERPSLLRNDGASSNWVGLRLVGTSSNRDALGARVVVTSGTLRQTKEVHTSGSFLSSSDPRLLFGLGGRERADEIRIRWPSGIEERLASVPAGRYHL